MNKARRKFIKNLSASAGLGFCGLSIIPLLNSCSSALRIQAPVNANNKLMVDTNLFNENNFIIVNSDKLKIPIYLVKISNAPETFKALSMLCTHKNCKLTATGSSLLTCHCHGSEFSTTGKVLKGPASEPLNEHQLYLENGKIEIDLNPLSKR